MDKVLELKMQLNAYIIDILNEDSIKQNFKKLLLEEFKNTLMLKKETLFQGEDYRIVRNSIKINLYKTFKAPNFKEGINLFINNNLKTLEDSNRTIESVVPPAVVNGIKVYVYNHKDELVDSLKNFLSSKDIDKKLYDELNNVLNGINPMVSRFVNSGNIFSKIKTAINDYLDNPKNIMDIVNMINTQLDSFMKKKLSELTSYFPAESRNALVNSISKSIMDNILSEKCINTVIDKVEEVLITILNSVHKNSFGSFDNILKDFMDTFYNKSLASDNAKELIKLLSNNIVDYILNKPLITLIEA
jgi:uncharacterized membrane protein YheB (UPF0754 family)